MDGTETMRAPRAPAPPRPPAVASRWIRERRSLPALEEEEEQNPNPKARALGAGFGVLAVEGAAMEEGLKDVAAAAIGIAWGEVGENGGQVFVLKY